MSMTTMDQEKVAAIRLVLRHLGKVSRELDLLADGALANPNTSYQLKNEVKRQYALFAKGAETLKKLID